jgi:hypothetical protein
MNKITCLIALALAALLSGCANTPARTATPRSAHWNDGVWNSVLGYHGPANTMADAGGP